MNAGSLMFPGIAGLSHGQDNNRPAGSLAQQALLGRLSPEPRMPSRTDASSNSQTGMASTSGRQGGPGAGPGASSFSGNAQLDLEALPTQRLEELLTDEAAMRAFTEGWLNSTAASKALEDIRQQNASLAQANLSMQGAIDQARTHVAIVRSGDYASAKDTFDDLYRRQEAVAAKLSPGVLLAAVRAEADKLDEEGEGVVERFEGGSLALEGLVEQYTARRNAYHLVDLKRQAAEQSI